MAKEVTNEQGFRVLEITREELVGTLGKYGASGICDYCNKPSHTGYYIAVLNCWYCPTCYERWSRFAVRYSEDTPHEISNYNKYK